MARITVEDCLDQLDNRFQLVLVATKRARQLSRGYEPLLKWENDKPTVVALREIAGGLVGPDILDQKDSPATEEPEVAEPGLDLTAEIAAEFARAGVSDDEPEDADEPAEDEEDPSPDAVPEEAPDEEPKD